MKKFSRIIQIIFGFPWLIFGLQHFIYVDFVANLVPDYFPARHFFAYMTGAAMIAAGISFIINVKARLAAVLLGSMLLMFVLLIHVRTLTGDSSLINWTRALQDIAIASSAFILAGHLSEPNTRNDFLDIAAKSSRYVFALLLIAFGVTQFLNLDFLTARVAPYLPLRIVWVYLTGAVMIIAGASVLFNKKAELIVFTLGVLMIILNLLLHVYLLVNEPRTGLLWTAAMLDLALTCGVFFLAESTSAQKTQTGA